MLDWLVNQLKSRGFLAKLEGGMEVDWRAAGSDVSGAALASERESNGRQVDEILFFIINFFFFILKNKIWLFFVGCCGCLDIFDIYRSCLLSRRLSLPYSFAIGLDWPRSDWILSDCIWFSGAGLIRSGLDWIESGLDPLELDYKQIKCVEREPNEIKRDWSSFQSNSNPIPIRSNWLKTRIQRCQSTSSFLIQSNPLYIKIEGQIDNQMRKSHRIHCLKKIEWIIWQRCGLDLDTQGNESEKPELGRIVQTGFLQD